MLLGACTTSNRANAALHSSGACNLGRDRAILIAGTQALACRHCALHSCALQEARVTQLHHDGAIIVYAANAVIQSLRELRELFQYDNGCARGQYSKPISHAPASLHAVCLNATWPFGRCMVRLDCTP